MNLKFKLDFQYDLEMLFEFLPEEKWSKNVNEIIELLEVDNEDIKRITKDKKTFDYKKVIQEIARQKYRRIQPFMEKSTNLFQDSWDKIIRDFSSLVEEKTESSWRYNNYYCVVSAFHKGISSWGGDTIVRKWSIHPDVQRPVTAHELVLSHFWSLLESHYKTKSWTNEKKWKYSEIFSWCLLGLEKEFHQFWPWLLKTDRWPLNHNYPEIIPLQKKIGALHKKHKKFRNFFKTAIKI